MAKYGSPSIVVKIDDSGGTPQDITQYVQTINGIEVEALTEESHPFGVAWVAALATGLKKMADVVIGGLYDDTITTGPDALLNALPAGPATPTRTLEITYGGTKKTTVEVIIAKYVRTAVRGSLHRYEATLRPTGTVTEA